MRKILIFFKSSSSEDEIKPNKQYLLKNKLKRRSKDIKNEEIFEESLSKIIDDEVNFLENNSKKVKINENFEDIKLNESTKPQKINIKSVEEKLEQIQNSKKPKISLQNYEIYKTIGHEEQNTFEDYSQEEEEEEEIVYKKNSSKKSKYTPLEQQYLEIRQKYKDTILFVESGYRYIFFDKDAEIASKILNIRASISHNFLSTSIPVHRLHVHALRLIQAGYKVGVVSQTETAALKSISNNKNTPFSRSLSTLYTKSTLVNDEMDPLDKNDNGNYLMSIYETNLIEISTQNKNLYSSEFVKISIVAVKTSTGDIIYDSFEDGPSRFELETRLRHLNPVEIVQQETISSQTKKIIQNTLLEKSKEDCTRIENIKMVYFQLDYCKQLIEEEISNLSSQENIVDSRRFFNSISDHSTCCFGSLIHYLKDFGLSSLVCLSCNINSFSNKNMMQIDGNCLFNLELLYNQSTMNTNGSLLSVIDYTKTAFGKRKLISWIRQPLFQKQQIDSRLDAVESLLNILNSKSEKFAFLESFSTLLGDLPDLEKGISRIYYQRCKPSEFLLILKAFRKVEICLKTLNFTFDSQLLNQLFALIPQDFGVLVSDFLDILNENFDDKSKLFVDETKFPKLFETRQKLHEIEAEFISHLKDIRKILKIPDLQFVTKNREEYIIEIKKTNSKLVPSNWIALASPKNFTRYHTPQIKTLYAQLLQIRETLNFENLNAWKSFVVDFSSKYVIFKAVVESLANLDCILSLTNLANSEGYSRPKITPNNLSFEQSQITIKNGRHPIVESLLNGSTFVPNDTLMGINEHDQKSLIITGPNMGGKTCYIKQVAILCIMAQIGSFIPCDSATITPIDAIYTRMGAYDNIVKGQSTFFIELEETSIILKNATQNSLAILDELGRGTSTHDGFSIAYATLEHLVNKIKCFTLFVTHYPALSQLTKIYPHFIQSHHISYIENNDQTKDPLSSNIIFLHKLVGGVESRSFGLNVARLSGLSPELISKANKLSKDLENQVKKHQYLAGLKNIYLLSKMSPIEEITIQKLISLQIQLSSLR